MSQKALVATAAAWTLMNLRLHQVWPLPDHRSTLQSASQSFNLRPLRGRVQCTPVGNSDFVCTVLMIHQIFQTRASTLTASPLRSFETVSTEFTRELPSNAESTSVPGEGGGP